MRRDREIYRGGIQVCVVKVEELLQRELGRVNGMDLPCRRKGQKWAPRIERGEDNLRDKGHRGRGRKNRIGERNELVQEIIEVLC